VPGRGSHTRTRTKQYVLVERDETGANLGPRSFSDVDASEQAADHAAYLDRAAGMLEEQRRGWFERLRLRSGDAVLDAGSGMGEVTRMLAGLVQPDGHAVGVDLSAELVGRARERAEGIPNVEFRVGNLTELPFDTENFDAAYSERVFQHLAEPDTAMAELFRVLRPGGRLVIVDADHGRAAVDADDLELSDLLTAAYARNHANPASGRRLRSQMVRAGFSDVTAEPMPQVITDAAQGRAIAARPLSARLDELVVAGLSRERADAHAADQERREAEGRYFVVGMSYLAVATKP
jgi:ubiquinone/menaquinone biosynthesis C-methylase UbiE